MGDPARANMLTSLMSGKALTAGELARVAGVTAQTASGHLTQLLGGGLLSVEKQGRHRYYRLAGADVAAALETLMDLTELASHRRCPASALVRGVAPRCRGWSSFARTVKGSTPVGSLYDFAILSLPKTKSGDIGGASRPG